MFTSLFTSMTSAGRVMHERTVFTCLFILSPIMTFNLTVNFTLNHYYKLLFIRITYYTKTLTSVFKVNLGFLKSLG